MTTCYKMNILYDNILYTNVAYIIYHIKFVSHIPPFPNFFSSITQTMKYKKINF